MKAAGLIRNYLGWCPLATAGLRHESAIGDDVAAMIRAPGERPPAGEGVALRCRDQLLGWAVFFTGISLPLAAVFLSEFLTRLMLTIGVITGLVIFACFYRWLLNSLGMLRKGATIRTGQMEYILTLIIAGAIPLSVILMVSALLCYISFAGALAFPAFATGFAYIPLYVLVLVVWWEKKTGCRVMFDRTSSSFTAKRCC